MSIITEPPRDFVEVDGERFKIHTDFRRWVKIGSIILNPRVDIVNKIVDTLKLCYIDRLPPSFEKAAYAMINFYSGDETKEQNKNKPKEQKSPVYDFEYDGDYIFAAFLAQYNIDLTVCNMHWHKFKALFAGLNEDCKIMEIMKYRAVDLCDIKDKEQKRFYRKMKYIYRLPDMRTEEEKERDMAEVFAEAFEM